MSATDLAERALIRVLLAEPSRVRDVRDWLRPSDVNHPKPARSTRPSPSYTARIAPCLFASFPW
ncbi:MAG TPA: hypothetical protein VF003_15785 [Pseudonocardiaceae bacterium]